MTDITGPESEDSYHIKSHIDSKNKTELTTNKIFLSKHNNHDDDDYNYDSNNDDNNNHYSRCNKITGVIKQQHRIDNDNDDIVVVDLEKELYSKINIDYDNYMTEKVIIILLTITKMKMMMKMMMNMMMIMMMMSMMMIMMMMKMMMMMMMNMMMIMIKV